jgi:hypothetical protein
MLHIVMSFPLAYLFAQISMDFGGMGLLNLMSLFIILGMHLLSSHTGPLRLTIPLGIGADDVFILVDAWKQSGLSVPRLGILFSGKSVL